jgi:hypothetical protein
MRKFTVLAFVLFVLLFLFAAPVAAVEDTQAPVIVALSVEPEVIDTSEAGRIITVTMLVTDDLSGVNFAKVSFYPDNSEYQFISVSAYFTQALTSELISIPVAVPRYAATGRWKASYIATQDEAGNFSYAYTTPYCVRNESDCLGSHLGVEFFNVYELSNNLYLPLLGG